MDKRLKTLTGYMEDFHKGTDGKCKHEWEMKTVNNGDRTYSLTERCSKCRKTRKVNPKNGRIQRR